MSEQDLGFAQALRLPRGTIVRRRSCGATRTRPHFADPAFTAFRKAIADHRTVYVPSGYYVISDTLTLRPDTVLVGLHPLAAQLDLLDRTPAFQGFGGPKPMVEAPNRTLFITARTSLYSVRPRP